MPTRSQIQKAKPKVKPKPKAKAKSSVHMGNALLRPGTMSTKIKEDMAKIEKAQAKKYGITVEEYRKAMGSKKR